MELQGTIKCIWKDVKDYEGIYQVSNTGIIKSLDHYCDGRFGSGKQTGRILKQQICKKGYSRVSLSRNKKRFSTSAHRLVAIAFISNPDNKPQVNHKNGIKTDNRVENLQWVTNRENQIHAVENNLIKHNKSEDHHNSKLKNKDVKDIRNRISKGEKQITITKEYNISAAALSQIKLNKTYKNL